MTRAGRKVRTGRKERVSRRERVDDDIERYGGDLLRSEVMRKAFAQKHHLRSTVGDHTLRVTRTGVNISHVLQKLHIPVDVRSVVVGSLCHDLGIIGRHQKYTTVRECYRRHPDDSAEVARELLPDLPEKTEKIIRRHMWPVMRSRIPDSIEGFVVSAADKYCSVVDLIRGRAAASARIPGKTGGRRTHEERNSDGKQ